MGKKSRPRRRRVSTGTSVADHKLGYYHGSQATRTSMTSTPNRRMNLVAKHSRTRNILGSSSSDRVAPPRRRKNGPPAKSIAVSLASAQAKKEKKKLADLKEKQSAESRGNEKLNHGMRCWTSLEDEEQVGACTMTHIERDNLTCLIENWNKFPEGMKPVIMETVVNCRFPLDPAFLNAVVNWVIENTRSDSQNLRDLMKMLMHKIADNLSRLVQQDQVTCEFLDKIISQCHSKDDPYFYIIESLVAKIVPSYIFVLQRHATGLDVLLKCTRMTGMDDLVVYKEIMNNSKQIYYFEHGCRSLIRVMAAAPSLMGYLEVGTLLTGNVGSKVKVVIASKFKPDLFRHIIEMGMDYAETVARCVVSGMSGIVRDPEIYVTEKGMLLTACALSFYEKDPDKYPAEWMNQVERVRAWFLREEEDRERERRKIKVTQC